MRILAALFALVATFGCKPSTPVEGSATKDAADLIPTAIEVCKCNDLACWKKESNARSIDSLKCAKDAIGTAFPVIDIPLSIAAGALEIAAAASELKTTAELLKEGSQLAKVVKESAPACVGAIAEHVGGLLSLSAKSLDAAEKFKVFGDRAARGDIDMKGIYDVLLAAGDPALELAKFAESSVNLTKCLDEAPAPAKIAEAKSTVTKLKETIFKVQKPWKDLSPIKKIDILAKGLKCGVSLVRGVNALAQNSLCLIDDFKEIDRQRAAIGRAIAYDGTRLLNHARWAGCGYCLTTRRIGASKNAEECKTCCRAPSNNPLPDWEPTKRGEWAEQCVSVCSAAYTEGVFVNYTDTRVCKERFEAARRDEAGHVFRYIDLLDASDRQKTKQEQAQIAQDYRGRAIAHIDTIKGSFAQFDGNGDGLISLAEMKAKADAQGAVGDAARFFGTETIVQADEISVNDLPYVKASVGKPYFFVLLETASNGGGNNADQYDDQVGTTDLDAFRAEIGQYKTEAEIAP